jgi:hypothetical protein
MLRDTFRVPSPSRQAAEPTAAIEGGHAQHRNRSDQTFPGTGWGFVVTFDRLGDKEKPHRHSSLHSISPSLAVRGRRPRHPRPLLDTWTGGVCGQIWEYRGFQTLPRPLKAGKCPVNRGDSLLAPALHVP